jgi:hypothetical protein
VAKNFFMGTRWSSMTLRRGLAWEVELAAHDVTIVVRQQGRSPLFTDAFITDVAKVEGAMELTMDLGVWLPCWPCGAEGDTGADGHGEKWSVQGAYIYCAQALGAEAGKSNPNNPERSPRRRTRWGCWFGEESEQLIPVVVASDPAFGRKRGGKG